MIALIVVAGAFGAMFVGCFARPSFQCASSTECSAGGAQGMCELDGFCSFADGTCPSGRRYGEHSGPLANQCVGAPVDGDAAIPDAPPDDAFVPDAFIPDARQCFGAGAYEVCFMAPPQGTLTLVGALDTATDARCLADQPASWTTAGQPDACFITAAQIDVTANLAVTGARPLVLIADTISVSAILDVASHRGGTLGPAANASQCAAFIATPVDAAQAAGGAGGSFMFAGGNGGRGDNDNAIAGGIAPPADSVPPTILRGGCGGQLGGTGAAAAGPPGPGGGAIYLAASTLTVTATGVINASGAGAVGGGAGAGGSGGGAGGMIVIHATALEVNGGRLLANGGGAAAGANVVANGLPGTDPSTATPTTPALGGNGPGGTGGNGFAGVTSATAGGSGNNRSGGGGGGGGGYIQSNLALTGASVSPAATVVP